MADLSSIDQARAAGYNDAEINSFLAPKMAAAREAGYSQNEINAHLGIIPPPPLDEGAIRKQITDNLAASPKPVTSFTDALEAGWQLGNIGMVSRGRAPSKAISPEAPMASRIAGQVAQMAGDLPAMMAGFGAGAAGAAFTGPGAVVGGTAGAMALPTALRGLLMDSYAKQQFGTWGDFWERVAPIFIDTAKQWVTGAATGGAGLGAKAAAPAIEGALPASMSPAVTAATKTAAEIGTMTTVGAAMEGHVPTAQEFVDAAIVLGGLKFAEVGASRLRTIYASKGIPPAAVIADAQGDPTVAQDLLSAKGMPDIYERGGVPEGMSDAEASGRAMAAAQTAQASTVEGATPGTPPGETPGATPFLAAERGRRPQDAVSFLASQGGMRPDGDLLAMDADKINVPFVGKLVRDDGMSLNAAREKLHENGYALDDSTDDRSVYGIISEHQSGRPTYRGGDLAEASAMQSVAAHNAEIVRLAAETGIDPAGKTRDQFFDQVAAHMSVEDQAAHLSEMDAAHESDVAAFEKAWTSYHGTPHEFDAFDTSKIGTGEGAQAFGHGLYFAENEGVAGDYRAKLSGEQVTPAHRALAARFQRMGVHENDAQDLASTANPRAAAQHIIGFLEKDRAAGAPPGEIDSRISAIRFAIPELPEEGVPENRGHLLTVRIKAKPEEMLDWDKPLSEQSPQVIEGLRKADVPIDKMPKWESAYYHPTTAEQSAALRAAGIKGIRYLDQGSRADGEGTHNVVVFDHSDVEITHRNGEPVASRPMTADEAIDMAGEPRTQEDMEREYQQETASNQLDQRTAGDGGPGSAAGPQGAGQEGAGPGGGNAGDAGRDGAAGSGAGGDLLAGAGGGVGGPPGPPRGTQGRLALPEPGKPPASVAEAQERILSHVSIGETDPKRPWSWQRIYTDTIDRLFPIWRASQEAQREAEISNLPANLDPGKLARLYAGAPGVAMRMLNFDTTDFATREVNGPGLRKILAPINSNLDAFRAYVTSLRAIELEGRDIKTGFDLNAARMVAEAGREQFGPIQAQLLEFQNRVAAYARDAGVLSREGYDAMLEANRLYVPFQRVMDPDFSAPTRISGGTLQARNPLHAIEGSERVVIDPLESVIRNTFLMTQMAERNNVGQALVRLLEQASAAGAPQPREETTAGTSVARRRLSDVLAQHGVTDPAALSSIADIMAPVAEGEIRVLQNGKPVIYEADPELARAFKALDQDSANWLVRLFALPARALRAGATLTPDFMARNLMRDFTTAFINTGKNIFSPIDTARGLMSAIRQDETYQRWISEGGASAAMVSLDRRYLQENLRTLTNETGLATRSWNVVRHPVESLRALSELSEQATRLGEFGGVYDKMISEGASPEEAGRQAAYSSREVTLDFARMGAKMRSVNMIVAFFNAQLQGVDRLARSAKDRPASTAMRILAGVTLPSALLWWANKDDQRVQDLPDWQKDLFWVVATDDWQSASVKETIGLPKYMFRQTADGGFEINRGHIWRIPKPFETGILFGSGVERVLDAFFKDKPEAFRGFSGSLMSGLLPSLLPTSALPVVEQFANRSTFTNRTLVPDQMEKMLPEYQYTPYTTETAKALGKIIGSFPGLRDASLDQGSAMGGVARSLSSPILLENYLRAWSGNLGMYALQVADFGLRKAGVVPDPPQPASTLADIPFVRAFVVRYPTASLQPVQDFQDDYTKNKTYFDTMMALAKGGDFNASMRVQSIGGPMTLVQLTGIQQAISEQSKLVRDIWKNPDISPEQKRQLIDTTYWRITELAKVGNQSMAAARRALAPAPATAQ